MQKVPTLQELHTDVNQAFKDDKLNLLLNQPPHASWLKKFPEVMGIKGEYLPIDKVEFMLTRIFQRWKVEILSVGVAFQSVYVTVRVHVRLPTDVETWTFHDGIGAAPIQTEKGASASDLSAIKNRAVQIAFPIAKSGAIKDAAEHFGALFGRDLNRKDIVLFSGAFTEGDAPPEAPAPTPPPPPPTITGPANADASLSPFNFNDL